MAGMLNGDFSIADNNDPNYGWNTRGGASVNSGQAILTEESPILSNFTQTFTVPENSKTLQFSFNAQLGLGDTNNFILPHFDNAQRLPDAFEVALLDANSQQSLLTNPLTSTVTVDISHIAPGPKNQPVLRLIGL